MNKGCTQTADNVTNIKSQKYHLLKQHKVGGDWRSNVALVRFGKKHGKCNCWGCYGFTPYSLWRVVASMQPENQMYISFVYFPVHKHYTVKPWKRKTFTTGG